MSDANFPQMPEGMPDLQALMQQAQAMQEQLMEAKAAAGEQVMQGTSAGGKVTISVTGGMDFQSVRIAPELGEDVEILEDLLLAALRDAMVKVNELNEEAVGGLFG
jgi:DNA-binding YbaB/EbfC family protein